MSKGATPDQVAATIAAFFEHRDIAELSPRRRLTWQVGDTAREIIEQLVDTRATDDDLAAVLTELEQVVGRLRRFDHGRRYDGYGEAATAGGEPPLGHADFSPLIGRANPIAPPMVFTLESEIGSLAPEVGATVNFGSAYEGPPGFVHGGIVAAAFDEIMGSTQALTGNPGMTGTLTISYRAPTPLHTDLRFVSRLAGIDGRKITVTSQLLAGEVLCAEATAVFISIDFDRLMQMQIERNQDSGASPDAAPDEATTAKS